MLSDVVHENDEFEKLPDGLVRHKYGCKDRGKIIGAYAMGFRNDRKYPVYVFAHLSEYYKAGKVWDQYTSAMILKVAEAMMLKRLVSISGLVTKEEMSIEEDDGSIKIQAVPKDITPKDIIEKVVKGVEKQIIEGAEASKMRLIVIMKRLMG